MKNGRRTAIVTGGAGFLGSHTVERLLADGFRVRALDIHQANIEDRIGACANDPNLTLEQTDLLQLDATASFYSEADYLFHCAGSGEHVESSGRPEQTIQANVVGVVRILEAARHHKIKKIIYPSSAAVYGISKAPTNETMPANPLNAYGLTKEMAELVFRRWSTIYNVSSVCFRIFNGYGPRAAKSGVVGVFLDKKLAGQPIRIHGDGCAKRDFIFVSDIVDAFLLATQHNTNYPVYNIGSGLPRTIKALAELIGGPIEFGPPRDGEPGVILADTTRISIDLGWEPTVGLEDGVSRTLSALDLNTIDQTSEF